MIQNWIASPLSLLAMTIMGENHSSESRFDRDDSLDLDRNLIGQHDIADSRAGVPTSIAEDLHEEIGTAIDDLRRIVEVRRGIDHTKELDDKIDAVERAERIAHGGKQAQSDQPRAPIAFLNADVDAEFAGELLAVGVARALAGEIKDVSGEPIRQIIGDWFAKLRQHNAEFLQARFRTHDLLLRNFRFTTAPASAPPARRQCRAGTPARR